MHSVKPFFKRARILRTTAAVAATGLATAGLATAGLAAGLAVPAAASPGPRQVVTGIQPSWAGASADRGPVASGAPVSVRVYLAGRDPAGLTRYAQQVAEPGQLSYRHFLTPAQFTRRFGPTGAQVSAVRGWLAGAGLTVTATTEHYVAARGTAAGMRAAFGSRLDRFRTAQGTLRAPRSAVTVPASVAPAILTVTGLSVGGARPRNDFTGLRADVIRSSDQPRAGRPSGPRSINEGP